MAKYNMIDVNAQPSDLPQPQPFTSAQAQAPTPTPTQTQVLAPHPTSDQVPSLALTPPPAQVPVTAAAAPAPNRIPEHLMYKNRLQEYCQRSSIALPVYQTVNEGYQHAPKFRSTVLVDGEAYSSPNIFSHRRAAEQDVAKLALECISKKIKDEGCPLINEDTVFCKSILNEFAVKMNQEMPTYKTVQSEGLLPAFVSSLVFDGIAYTGETGRNKKEAEQLAARTVIRSLLGTSGYGTVLSEIIKSKTKLYAALNKVKDSKYSTQNISKNNVPAAAIFEARTGMHPMAANFEASTRMYPLPAIPVVNSGMHPIAAITEASAGIYSTAAVPGASTGMHAKVAIPRPSFGMDPTAAAPEESTGMHPTVAAPEANTGINSPCHQFKSPKLESSGETIDRPISFVPPGLGQPSLVGPNCTNKRRKNKRKPNKKLRTDAQLCNAAQPLAQAPPCSVAQMNSTVALFTVHGV